jgi:ferrous iron transport protein B
MDNVLLIGNPNVGKSMVFSRLTGVHVESSNYPGTTVEIAKGKLMLGGKQVEVCDLPGTYALEPSSKAEEVAVELLRQHAGQDFVVIDVIDATNLERNLSLTLELIEQGFPLVVCVNMSDEMQHHGISIDMPRLETLLGVPVVPTCAVTGVGIKALIERIAQAKKRPAQPRSHEERWLEIGRIVGGVQQLTHRHHTVRELIEDASVRPWTGFLMAAAVMYAAFMVVRVIAESLIRYVLDPFFLNIYQPLLERATGLLCKSDFIYHVLIGDLINGRIDFKQSMGLLTTAPYIELAMVLPYVFSFYLVLSFLEDVGFLPRLALLMDNFFHRLGLHGHAIIPVLLGFGCNVPGILATRSLETRRERFVVSVIISIGVPCVTLQAMIIALLGAYSGWYIAGVYAILFALWIVLGVILNSILKGDSPELLLEIPSYRLPPFGLLMQKLYLRVKGFLVEPFPIVLAGVFVVNALVYFKVLDTVTGLFAPFLQGLFGLPKEASIAFIIGFLRKDVAAGMLMPLGLTAKQMFISTVLLAISFPCIATFAVLLKELGMKYLLYAIAIMLIVGLVVGGVLNFTIPL